MIKNVSSTFKANCKKDSVKYREYIVIDNKEVDIKGNLSDTAYKDDTFFGKFNLKMLKFETENDIDYKKKEFTYYKEVDGEALKIGTFIVTEVKDSDTFESVNVTAYDYGLKLSNPYTTNLNYKNGNITMFQVVQEICNNCDIELENTSLPNGSFIVDSNQFVNGEKYGDVICIVALENGMFATINSNNKLEFIFTNETDEIIEDYVELDDKRDTQPITSVLVAPSEELATAGAVMKDQALINQYGEHWLKIYDSYFANSTTKCQQLISAIFNQVKGFGYSSFKSEYSFLPYLTLGDKIKFKNKEGKLVDSIILRYETNYDEMILEAPSIINASIEYELPETPEEISKKALVKVDQANGEIELIAKATEELNSKTTQLRLDVDKIEGEISDIADITVTSEGTGTIEVLNVAGDSEPIYLKVRPTTKNLALLYPADNLYPSDDLYPLERYLLFKNGSYEQRYRLPADLWYYNSTTYDEFVLDYNNQRSYVIHRVGVNADGTTYVLDSVTEEDFTYPSIPLTEGDYKISLEGHETAYIYARLMANSIYTNQFATKVELNSKITQVNNEIDLSVSQLATNFDKEVENLQGEINVQAGKVVLKADANGNIVKAELTADPAEGTAFNVKADNINFNGKNFNLTSDNMSIISTNFSVDKNGKVTAKEAEITGGDIRLTSSGKVAKITLIDRDDNSQTLQMSPRIIRWMKGTNALMTLAVLDSPVLGLNSATTSEAVNINPYYTTYKNSSNEETIRLSGSSGNISCVSLTQTSLEKYKMNIERYTGALKEIEKIDVYKYNLKVENKDTKKHIGFIIGDKYRYSKEITNNEDNGVELYSMTSLCLQAIKEQQEIINKLQERVSFLENQKI